MSATQRWIDRLARARFIYLGVLPSVASFALVLHGRRDEGLLALLLFLGAAVFVAGYMWALTFHRPPKSIASALLQVFAGPAFALLSRPRGEALIDLSIRAFLVDGAAMLLAVLWLGWRTPQVGGLKPRLALTGGVAVVAASVVPLFSPLWQAGALSDWRQWLPLAVGVVQGAAANLRGLETEQRGEAKDAADAGARLGPLLFLWILAMMAAWGYSSVQGRAGP